MSQPIKVLMADDSTVVRQLLKSVLDAEDDIEVVRPARNGVEAVAFFPQCKPDVVVLDVEMPEMDGVEAAKQIRAIDKDVPIIMFSSLTTQGGEAALDALAAGASDCVAKPSGQRQMSEAVQCVQDDLVRKIRAWGNRGKPATAAPVAPSLSIGGVKTPSVESNPVLNSMSNTQPNAESSSQTNTTKAEIIAVGVSTGGPPALATFLDEFPANFPLPVVIVQHMLPVFTKLLAERLDRTCALPVREAADGIELVPGQVWLAPGGKHLEVIGSSASKRLLLNEDPPENSCRPAVDVLFRSVAKCYGDACLAVVMTGMGQDGLIGCQQLRSAGSSILVQDEASSVVWGMPGVVAQAGLADGMMNPQELGREVVRIARSSCLSAASR